MSETVKREVLLEGKFLRFCKANHWEYVERANVELAVVIIAQTKEGKVLFTEQHRPPVGGPVVELPAGLVGDIQGEEDECARIAAQRELLEETGYEAEKIEILARGPISPGLSNEMIELVRAHNLRKVHEGGGVELENITVHAIPKDEVETWLAAKQRDGVFIDPKVYSGLYFLG